MEIKLLGMRLENFMCYVDTEFSFFHLTKILAENGRGKSSIVTAFNWVLFNCDYELRDNPQVRRVVDGKSVDDMDTAVTLVLDVDGREITMKKVQKRTYSKDGSSYKDDNKYFVNDVPKTLRDFNAYLDIDINVFKICSNVNAYLDQKPAEMREYLFGLVGNVTDLDIASQKAELAELVPLLNKYTVEELSAMNKATKANITKELPVLDGQIKEKERDIQLKQGIDVSDLELQKNSLKEQIADCVAKQTDNDKLMAEYDKASSDILNLKFELNDMSRKANEGNEKAKRTLTGFIDGKKKRLYEIANGIQDNNRKITDCQYDIETGTKLKDKLAEDWKRTNSEKFDENTAICPACRRELPTEQVEELRSSFAQTKAERLAKIEEQGLEAKRNIERAQEQIKMLEEFNETNLANQQKVEAEIAYIEKQLSELPQEIDVSTTEEYKALEQQIAEKEQAMHKANDISAVKAELKVQESELRQQLSECEAKIAASNTAMEEERLEELRNRQRDMEQGKTNAEKILDLLDELDKAKNEAFSDAINSHFGLVKWQLFEYAKNGNYKSVCVPMVDGKSILTTMSNKGNRILGRIDICNSIQKISGITCPIWLDDAESLDESNQSKVAQMVGGQAIMLIVDSKYKDLEIMEG